jgi:adenylate cyclase
LAIEIERKFLVTPGAWIPRDAGTHIQQGYLSAQNGCTVRVRIERSEAVSRGLITVKGPTTGISRSEFEYAIPFADARFMLDELCEPPLIDKHRYLERHGRHTWEIDVFHGDNEGLIVAEVEMQSEDDVLELPPWAGQDVSFDFRYSNANLRKAPFNSWTE